VTSPGVTVVGEKRLAVTMHAAATDLADMSETNAKVARFLTARARARAPRRSGRLAASGAGRGTRDEALVEFAAPYAGPIHFGWPARHIGAQPFAAQALASGQHAAVAVYETELVSIVNKIKGA
jgi:hypothetical protein